MLSSSFERIVPSENFEGIDTYSVDITPPPQNRFLSPRSLSPRARPQLCEPIRFISDRQEETDCPSESVHPRWKLAPVSRRCIRDAGRSYRGSNARSNVVRSGMRCFREINRLEARTSAHAAAACVGEPGFSIRRYRRIQLSAFNRLSGTGICKNPVEERPDGEQTSFVSARRLCYAVLFWNEQIPRGPIALFLHF